MQVQLSDQQFSNHKRHSFNKLPTFASKLSQLSLNSVNSLSWTNYRIKFFPLINITHLAQSASVSSRKKTALCIILMLEMTEWTKCCAFVICCSCLCMQTVIVS